MSARRPARSTAEWVTFAVSVLVLGVVVVLVATTAERDRPARPTATVDASAVVRREGDFHVPVEVVNAGGRSAANVQVLAELVSADGTESAEQTVDFLGADEQVHLVFVFETDPADGDLSVVVGGFAVP